MNTALFLLLFAGDGDEGAGPQGFLCVRSVTIRPGLKAATANSPGMECESSIKPGLTGSVEANQCQ
jgi:hypothetical protein